MKFSAHFRDQAPSSLSPHLDQFETITAALARESNRTILWRPPEDSRALIEHHLDMIWMVYVNKFHVLCQALIQALNSDNFFVYGLIGRSLIEHTAILRYYIHDKMSPLLADIPDHGPISEALLKEVITLLRRHLTGHRFDWDTFLSDYFDQLERPKSGNLLREPQVNVITCLEKWIRQNDAIEGLYNLFCDLVHPNLGSTLLVSRLVDHHIGVGGQQGRPVGIEIFSRTFTDLLALSQEVDEQLRQLKRFQQQFQSSRPIEFD